MEYEYVAGRPNRSKMPDFGKGRGVMAYFIFLGHDLFTQEHTI
jgi:hypothetical protein